MVQIISFLDYLAIVTFALSLYCLRHTIRAILEGNPQTFPFWSGLNEQSFYFKLKFSLKTIKATYCKGQQVVHPYGSYENQSYVAEVADKKGLYTFNEGKRLFAAGKAGAWGTLTLWLSGLTFVIKICLPIIKYIAENLLARSLYL